jgi:OmpA-OmpF porin, OOP family
MALTAITSSTALADDSSRYDSSRYDSSRYDSGWYLGANIGQSRSDIDNERITQNLLQGGLSTASFDENDRDTGFKLLGGYQFNRYMAIEGGYFDLGKFDFTVQTLPLGTLTGEIKLKGINADTKDSFRGTGAVNVVDPEARERQANLKLGLGLQYAFNDAWAMRLETDNAFTESNHCSCRAITQG